TAAPATAPPTTSPRITPPAFRCGCSTPVMTVSGSCFRSAAKPGAARPTASAPARIAFLSMGSPVVEWPVKTCGRPLRAATEQPDAHSACPRALQRGERIAVRRAGDAALGDDGGDIAGRADDDATDAARGEQRSGGHVGEERDGNVVLKELPRRQARALQPGARLVGEDGDSLPLLDRGADDAERGAVAGGGEAAGVAVG